MTMPIMMKMTMKAPTMPIISIYVSLVKAVDTRKKNFNALAIMSMMVQDSFLVEYNISDNNGFPWSKGIWWYRETRKIDYSRSRQSNNINCIQSQQDHY
jgi:hypothetical protein